MRFPAFLPQPTQALLAAGYRDSATVCTLTGVVTATEELRNRAAIPTWIAWLVMDWDEGGSVVVWLPNRCCHLYGGELQYPAVGDRVSIDGTVDERADGAILVATWVRVVSAAAVAEQEMMR